MDVFASIPDQTFDTMMPKEQKNKRILVVCYYRDTCPHCKDFKLVWNAMVELTKNMGEINSDIKGGVQFSAIKVPFPIKVYDVAPHVLHFTRDSTFPSVRVISPGVHPCNYQVHIVAENEIARGKIYQEVVHHLMYPLDKWHLDE